MLLNGWSISPCTEGLRVLSCRCMYWRQPMGFLSFPLFFLSSLPPFPPLSRINEHILWWGLKKRSVQACLFTQSPTQLCSPGKPPAGHGGPREVKELPPLSLLTVLRLDFWTSLSTVWRPFAHRIFQWLKSDRHSLAARAAAQSLLFHSTPAWTFPLSTKPLKSRVHIIQLTVDWIGVHLNKAQAWAEIKISSP